MADATGTFWNRKPAKVPGSCVVRTSPAKSCYSPPPSLCSPTLSPAPKPSVVAVLSPQPQPPQQQTPETQRQPSPPPSPPPLQESMAQSRDAKFRRLLEQGEECDLAALRKLAWNGIPPHHRPTAWKLLMGYLPTLLSTRQHTLAKKRAEYHDMLPHLVGQREKSQSEEVTMHQILIDLPRTCPNVSLFSSQRIRDIMARVLYSWAMLHPASGYVQGLNDLVTPILLVFLSEHAEVFCPDGTLRQECDLEGLSEEVLSGVEADCFWCMTKLLDGIQDNYINDQPGIQRALGKLKDVVGRIDSALAGHLERENALFVEFAFRWINNLLMRELSLPLIVRLWDTYFSEPAGDGFSVLHVYTCASMLLVWSRELMSRTMPDLMIFLQHLPTESWREPQLEVLLSRAFQFQTMYDRSHHLSPANSTPTPR